MLGGSLKFRLILYLSKCSNLVFFFFLVLLSFLEYCAEEVFVIQHHWCSLFVWHSISCSFLCCCLVFESSIIVSCTNDLFLLFCTALMSDLCKISSSEKLIASLIWWIFLFVFSFQWALVELFLSPQLAWPQVHGICHYPVVLSTKKRLFFLFGLFSQLCICAFALKNFWCTFPYIFLLSLFYLFNFLCLLHLCSTFGSLGLLTSLALVKVVGALWGFSFELLHLSPLLLTYHKLVHLSRFDKCMGQPFCAIWQHNDL